MSYQIIIKQTKTVTKKQGGEWEVVGEKPITKEDWDESPYHERQKGLPDDVKMKRVWGHTPPVEKDVEVEETILDLRVDELDLDAVVKAALDLD